MGRPKAGYRNAAGEKIPGTTTIISRFKDSGALIQWAYKQGREHEDLSHRGLPAPKYLYDSVEKAAEAGTIAHDLIEAYIQGKPVERLPQNEIEEKAQNAFVQFEQWFKQNQIQIITTELSLVSEKYQFGGTVDAVGSFNGQIVLLDWKTSNAIYSDYLIQLAAYGLLLQECRPELYPTGGYHLLRISKENADFGHFFFGELNDASASFVLMRQLYDLDGKLKARTK